MFESDDVPDLVEEFRFVGGPGGWYAGGHVRHSPQAVEEKQAD